MDNGGARLMIVVLVLEVIVLDQVGNQGAQVLVKRAAHGHVEHLQAPANAENRLAITQGPADQAHFRPIAGRIGPPAEGVPLLVVALRIDVHAAGEKNTVET